MRSNVNREKIIPPLIGLLILVAAFLLIYQPWRLCELEFFRMEGFYAAQTLEMDASMPLATAHGVAIRNAFPLYPLVGSILYSTFGWPLEFTLRFLSIAMVLLCSVLIYVTVRNSRSHVAAQAATAMFIATNLMMEKSPEALPYSMVMLGLLGAHLSFFYFSIRRSNYNLGWLTSLGIMALTFYAGGFITLLYFAFPFLFMRRPLGVWNKFNKVGLLGGVLLVAGMIALWGMPYAVFSNMMPLHSWRFDSGGFLDYIANFVEFPFYVTVRFLPWVLIAWAPFCVNLQMLDETPIFGRYLRTLVIANFFLIWFLPDTESYDLFILAGPLAILTGMHYEAAVRRYSVPMKFFMKMCAVFMVCIGGAIVVFLFTPSSWLEKFISASLTLDFRGSIVYTIAALTAAMLISGMGVYTLLKYREQPVWLTLLLTSAAIGIFYWTVQIPYRAQDKSRTAMGMVLNRALVDNGANVNRDLIIYKNNIQDLYTECLQINASISKIDSLDELPQSSRTVYLLSTGFPEAPDWNWSNLLPPDLIYMRHRLCLWKGEPKSDSIKSVIMETQSDE